MIRYRNILLFLFVTLLFTEWATGQPDRVHHLGIARELSYGIGGTGLLLLGNTLRDRTPDIILADLEEQEIPAFDRIATRLSSEGAAFASDWALSVSVALPGLLLIPRHTRSQMGTITLLYGETILITQGLTQIIKSTALRPRPYVFDENLPATTVLESNDRAAFLSGHTSISAAAAFFTARVFADYFPDSKAKPYVWGGAAAVPALMGYLRVRAGRHYPSDVIAGYALGALVGYAVPALHRKPRAKNWVRVSAGTTGLYLSYRW